MATNSQEELLGQLEREVKLVFEHTGRLFAAAARSNGKTTPTAQISKLKQTLRTSDRRFHEALDLLENELQTAKLVMRRDLALLREESGLGKPQAVHSDGLTGVPDSEIVPKSATDVKPPQSDAIQDTLMQDSEPVQTDVPDDEDGKGADTTRDASTAEGSTAAAGGVSTEAGASQNTTTNDEKPAETTLAIETSTKPEGDSTMEEDKPPDTATFSNTNDFDSLFGGPMSAGPVDAPGFDLDTKVNDEFDFDAFASSLDNANGADNDNISALLPGLEDYANTQPGGVGEPDFGSLFNPIDGDGEQGSNTFDDLGDLLDFNTEFDAGGEGGNDEFDFST